MEPSFVSASFVSASFVSASFVSASFVSASFVSASFVSASFVRASFVRASFVRACRAPDDLPDEPLLEVAVAGRSNCGKSSLINALTGHGKLARTSSTPGRTRELLFFRVCWPGADPFHLVDLPGYGYARVSRSEREAWGELVTGYIEGSQRLRAMLLLIDMRRGAQQEERDLLSWCAERGVEPLVALTKADKLSKNQRFAALNAARRELSLTRRPWAASAHEGLGVLELRRAVLAVLQPPASPPTAAPEGA